MTVGRLGSWLPTGCHHPRLESPKCPCMKSSLWWLLSPAWAETSVTEGSEEKEGGDVNLHSLPVCFVPASRAPAPQGEPVSGSQFCCLCLLPATGVCCQMFLCSGWRLVIEACQRTTEGVITGPERWGQLPERCHGYFVSSRRLGDGLPEGGGEDKGSRQTCI